jgi:hypothetical protein
MINNIYDKEISRFEEEENDLLYWGFIELYRHIPSRGKVIHTLSTYSFEILGYNKPLQKLPPS